MGKTARTENRLKMGKKNFICDFFYKRGKKEKV